MDFSIAAILAQDGITNGAVYALLALALVLVFSVTRIIFIPQGEFVAYGALSLAAIQAGQAPASARLLLAMGLLCLVKEVHALWRTAGLSARNTGMAALKFLLLPSALWWVAGNLPVQSWPQAAQAALALSIVVPMGPMVYRLAYQPLAEASTLVLLIVSVGVHYALTGLGLVMFGAEGSRTTPFTDASFDLGAMSVSGQSLVVVAVSAVLIAALYLYFERSLSGKALRATAVNRLGAQLVGIGTTAAGRLAFTLAAALGALCGVLIAPLTTVYYDGGFLIGLKGFVGAIIGGLVSYPLAAAGAVLVGLLESYSSFWASAYKEVLVFTLIIPVLLWRSLNGEQHDEEEE
jgi:branched-chain amino acid transport system permease protein